jgi:SNF2 family DNA or RNA helicase
MNYCTKYNDKIKINFHENDFETMYKVQSLTGRRYVANEWYAPIHINNLNSLTEWGFFLDDDLREYIERTKVREKEIVENADAKLYDFQKTGVAFIETQGGRCMLADEMGCGKSIQSLSWLGLHKERIPVLIVCPASLKLNWKRETEKWLTSDVEILKGVKTYPTTKDVLIINYDILYAWVNELKKKNLKVMILDEHQAIKEKKAKRTKAVKKLKDVPYIIALSGTPMMNRQTELDNIINLIAPDSYPTMCVFSEGKIHTILKTSFMLRRLKKDVLKELPDKTFSFVPIELDNEREYRIAEDDFIEFVRQEKGDAEAERLRRFEGLVKTEGLKQLATKGKMQGVIGWIRTFLESGEKLVVFCTHTIVVQTLMNEFEAVKVDGTCSATQKQKAVDEFQNGNVKLFVGNIKAAGAGITLTSSSNVAIIELPWSPMDVNQSIDRCHRISQKNAVNAYYLLADNTVEERIARLLDKKRKSIDAIIDGEDTSDESLIVELMNEYRNIKV